MLYNPLFLHFLRGILNAINRNLEGIKMAVSNIKAILKMIFIKFGILSLLLINIVHGEVI